MGIAGLLQGLKPFSSPGNIRNYEGQSVAVDASSWLHKSVYSIAEHYVETLEKSGGNEVDQKCISTSSKYIVTRCQDLLTYAKIRRIFLVMDGERCPLKAATNQERERRREANLKEAQRYKKQNRNDKAFEKYKACIKVCAHLTQEVAKEVSKKFRRDERVELVWAPLEADAQLAKLCVQGSAQAVITEDSDVLVYSATCRVAFPILFKLDRRTGTCDVISMDWLLSASSNSTNAKATTLVSILDTFTLRESRDRGLGVRLFVQACVLAGCDYAPNQLNGVGLVNAFKHVRDSLHRPSGERFRHLLKHLPRKARKDVVDMERYEELLSKSEAVFYYHPICEADRQVNYLNQPCPTSSNGHLPSLERFGDDWHFLGQVSVQEDQAHPAVAEEPSASNVLSVPSVIVVKKNIQHGNASRQRTKTASVRHQTCFPANSARLVANPYQGSRKRKHEGGREPLQPRVLNEKKDPHHAKISFHHMAFHGDENSRYKNRRLPENVDVRFVKPKFPKYDEKHARPMVSAIAQRPFSDSRTSSLDQSGIIQNSGRWYPSAVSGTESENFVRQPAESSGVGTNLACSNVRSSFSSSVTESFVDGGLRHKQQSILPVDSCYDTRDKNALRNSSRTHGGMPSKTNQLHEGQSSKSGNFVRQPPLSSSEGPNLACSNGRRSFSSSVAESFVNGGLRHKQQNVLPVDSCYDNGNKNALRHSSRTHGGMPPKKAQVHEGQSSKSFWEWPSSNTSEPALTFHHHGYAKRHSHDDEFDPLNPLGNESHPAPNDNFGEGFDYDPAGQAPVPQDQSSDRKEDGLERTSLQDGTRQVNSNESGFGDNCQFPSTFELDAQARGAKAYSSFQENDTKGFDFYDDFLSPSKEAVQSRLEVEDTVESPSFSIGEAGSPFTSINFDHSRRGLETSQPPIGPLGQAFERQRQRATSLSRCPFATSSYNRAGSCNRKPFSLGLMQTHQSRGVETRGTILSHFSPVIEVDADF